MKFNADAGQAGPRGQRLPLMSPDGKTVVSAASGPKRAASGVGLGDSVSAVGGGMSYSACPSDPKDKCFYW
eukprot:8757578-Pyramimonas_sp.AAC.1